MSVEALRHAHCYPMFCVIVKCGLRYEVFTSSINNPFCWYECIIIIILHLRVGLGTGHFLSVKPNIFIPNNYVKFKKDLIIVN